MEQRSNRAVEEIVAAIQALDLEPIKFKLMDRDEGEGWSREHAERMETAYKRFLTLLVTHPETPIAPTKEIDKFWHGHILDTMKYAEDCERVFGYFLHHFPYFGMRGEEDAAQLAQAGTHMDRLYQQEFGESIPGAESAFCWASRPAASAAQDSAFCWASRPQAKLKDGSAFCWASRPAADAAQDSAFCWANGPATQAPDTATRPRLALAA